MAQYYYTWTSQKAAESFELVSASDDTLNLKDDRSVIDLSSTSYQVSFGHSCAEITSAIKKQIDNFSIASPKADFDLKRQVTNDLLKLIDLDHTEGKIFYTVSGAESIENALKIARQIKKKKVIACRQVSYHGATLGALSITGDWRNQAHETVDDWTLRIPEPSVDPEGLQAIKQMEKFGTDKIAALCLETITGGNGVFLASANWWTNIQQFCQSKSIFLILDEVICGFYRTGKAFGFHHYHLKPDIITLSKSITGGYVPFGAVWTSGEIADFYENRTFACGLTNYAHPLGLAATRAVLDLTQKKEFQNNLQVLIKVFEDSLNEILKFKNVQNIRHIGLLAAIDYRSPFTFKTFLEEGLYLNISQERIMLAPMLNQSPEKLETTMKKLITVMENLL